MGFPAILDELHRRGHDANAVDFTGRSVAQDAAEFGHVEVLSLVSCVSCSFGS